MAPLLDLVGQTLAGTYHVDRVLGVGGMGAVFEASNVRIGKRFAIKALLPAVMAQQEAVKRFHREAKIATDIGHPHIVEVIDFNQTDDGVQFMVMELLEGEDLEARLARVGTLAPERAVAITSQVCSALHAAHGKGIVHRDLKPGNIFLCSRGDQHDFVKVVDFGISKVVGSRTLETQDASLLGTPGYMAPEQAEGKNSEVGPCTDIFAMGGIFYLMLAGRPPFEGDSLPTLLYKVVHQDPDPLPAELPPALPAVVSRALAKRPEQRYATMKELALALQVAVPDFRDALGLSAGIDLLSDTAAAAPLPGSGPGPGSGPATVDPLTADPDAFATAPTVAPTVAPTDTTLSGAAGALSHGVEAPPQRRGPLVLVTVIASAAVVVALLAGFGLWRSRGDDAQPKNAQPKNAQPNNAQPKNVTVAVAQPDAAAPAKVTIWLQGGPAGAQVQDAANGEWLGTLPVKLSWPRAKDRRTVVIKLKNHLPRSLTFVPSEDRTFLVELKRRTRPRRSAKTQKIDPERINNPHGP